MTKKSQNIFTITVFKDFVYFYSIMDEEKKDSKKDIFLKWIRRMGVWGFLFFLVKGLIWLAVGYWVVK
jgi:hypothetical protein